MEDFFRAKKEEKNFHHRALWKINFQDKIFEMRIDSAAVNPFHFASSSIQ